MNNLTDNQVRLLWGLVKQKQRELEKMVTSPDESESNQYVRDFRLKQTRNVLRDIDELAALLAGEAVGRGLT